MIRCMEVTQQEGAQMNLRAVSPARVPVDPPNHDDDCRRGEDATSQHYGLDLELCDRCINLWARLDEVAVARESAAALTAKVWAR